MVVMVSIEDHLTYVTELFLCVCVPLLLACVLAIPFEEKKPECLKSMENARWRNLERYKFGQVIYEPYRDTAHSSGA